MISVLEKGIIVVSANANTDINSYPAIFENVISVSSGKTNNKFDYKFNNDELCECIADGFPNDALTISGIRSKIGGNSFAAPVITGILALFIQKYNIHCLEELRKLLKKFSVNNRIIN